MLALFDVHDSIMSYQRLSTIPMSQQQQKNELGDFIFSVVFLCIIMYSLN